jgi:predicted ribosome quality control (RQC) complex YloA/Tae2 family protein
LILAAHLAGYFSKAKDKEKIFIDYTKRKYVKRPKNAKPGKVIYSKEKSVLIKLNHQEIKKNIIK